VGPVSCALVPGGGLSRLSKRYEFIVDNVVSFNVVIADGTVVTVSAISKFDVSRVLKGGSNNFGESIINPNREP
jgi:hypothetical protein